VNNLPVTFRYDGLGQRVQKVDGTVTPNVTTVYVYDAFGQLAAETPSGITAPACQTCYLSWDHLGTTRMVTDSATLLPVVNK
jgi:hypothetical protein